MLADLYHTPSPSLRPVADEVKQKIAELDGSQKFNAEGNAVVAS